MKINESKGTPNVLIEILKEYNDQIIDIINHTLDDSITLDIDKSINVNINVNNKIIYFKCNIIIFFHFKSKNYRSNINFDECINTDFKNCKINQYVPTNNINNLLIFKSILHELTHVYELYQIKEIYKNSESIFNI